ncbi:MAG: hypothetical protein ACK4JD_05515 [Thermoflexales bacterium]
MQGLIARRALGIALRAWLALVILYAPVVCLAFCRLTHAAQHRAAMRSGWQHEWATRHLPAHLSEPRFQLDAPCEPFLAQLRELIQSLTDVEPRPPASLIARRTLIGLLTCAQVTRARVSIEVPHPPPRAPEPLRRA